MSTRVFFKNGKILYYKIGNYSQLPSKSNMLLFDDLHIEVAEDNTLLKVYISSKEIFATVRNGLLTVTQKDKVLHCYVSNDPIINGTLIVNTNSKFENSITFCNEGFKKRLHDVGISEYIYANPNISIDFKGLSQSCFITDGKKEATESTVFISDASWLAFSYEFTLNMKHQVTNHKYLVLITEKNPILVLPELKEHLD